MQQIIDRAAELVRDRPINTQVEFESAGCVYVAWRDEAGRTQLECRGTASTVRQEPVSAAEAQAEAPEAAQDQPKAKRSTK